MALTTISPYTRNWALVLVCKRRPNLLPLNITISINFHHAHYELNICIYVEYIRAYFGYIYTRTSFHLIIHYFPH